MKRMILCVLIGCAGAIFSGTAARAQSANAAEQAGPYPLLEIRDVTVIDGSGAPAFGPVNIFIKGNRIERVVPSDSISRREKDEEGAGKKEQKAPDRVIEGKGMYVMPGLIDVHIHINANKDVPAEYIYKLLLGHGVTTVRTFNVGNDDPKGMVEEKKKIAANQIIAPRMYVYPFWDVGTIRGIRIRRGRGRLWMNGMPRAWMESRLLASRGFGRTCFTRLRTRRGRMAWASRCTLGKMAFIR